VEPNEKWGVFLNDEKIKVNEELIEQLCKDYNINKKQLKEELE